MIEDVVETPARFVRETEVDQRLECVFDVVHYTQVVLSIEGEGDLKQGEHLSRS